jgi:SAM-dependent methyltransferase
MMLPPRPTTLAHEFASQALREGDLAVDATCGNGHDTLHLALLVGPKGKVVAIDVQADALEQTRARLESTGLESPEIQLIHACHSRMGEFVAPSSAALVMFNLGYLPGGDHTHTTRADTTAAALDQAVEALRPGGLLMVTCYPGHPEGAIEAETVKNWMKTAASHHTARIAKYSQPFTRTPAPILWLAAKPCDMAP